MIEWLSKLASPYLDYDPTTIRRRPLTPAPPRTHRLEGAGGVGTVGDTRSDFPSAALAKMAKPERQRAASGFLRTGEGNRVPVKAQNHSRRRSHSVLW